MFSSTNDSGSKLSVLYKCVALLLIYPNLVVDKDQRKLSLSIKIFTKLYSMLFCKSFRGNYWSFSTGRM